ncbi:MAG: hypothetical protein WAO22_09395 [bacterium]|nr:hypothetical protein [Bacillota bacterium]
MDVIRLVVQIVFLSFFYWFILSVVRAMERDIANQREEDAKRPYRTSGRGGD